LPVRRDLSARIVSLTEDWNELISFFRKRSTRIPTAIDTAAVRFGASCAVLSKTQLLELELMIYFVSMSSVSFMSHLCIHIDINQLEIVETKFY
jgi:ornithine carbamoyltransferase